MLFRWVTSSPSALAIVSGRLCGSKYPTTTSTPRAFNSWASSSILYVLPTPAAYPMKIFSLPPFFSGIPGCVASLREDADVHAARLFDQPVHGGSPQARTETGALAVTDEQLCDALRFGEIEDGCNRVLTVQNFNPGPRFARHLKPLIQ